MMRPLLFDFPEDEKAAAGHDSFMFGPSLLVCPVTKPMYYLPGGEKMDDDTQRTWDCYLPAGTDWYGFESGERYEGGQTLRAAAGIECIPVFVMAGSILPMEEKLSYVQEAVSTPLQLHIYPGADACFR